MRNVTGHSIRFFATSALGERTPRRSDMPNGLYAWDATCSCGWASVAADIMPVIDRDVAAHKAAVVTAFAEKFDSAADADALETPAPAPTNAEMDAEAQRIASSKGLGRMVVEQPVVELPEPSTTSTPYTLAVAGKTTVFSRKDKAVAYGEKLGLTYTVINPKGSVVASRVV